MTASADERTTRLPRATAARLAGPAVLILGLGALLASLLVLPGQTVVTRAIDQLFQSYDGIHRVLSGQVPGRDLRSAAGPLALLLPAWGFRLSGGYGGALPTALALGLAPVTLAAAHILASRLRPGLAVLMGAVLLVALAAPMHPGEPVTFLSYSDLPNRIGWAASALVLVMVLDPRRDGPATTILDGLAGALLVLLTFYTKASFAAAAVAVLLFALLVGHRRLWVGMALLAAVATAGLLDLAWGGTRQYLADLRAGFEAGGWLRLHPDQILRHVRHNLSDYLLVGVVAAVALRREWSPRLLLFLVACVLARAWLLGQNDPRWSVLVPFAAAAVMAEHLLRAIDRQGAPPTAALVNPAGVQLFFAALVLPTAVRCASAVALHAGAALAGAGTPLPFPGMEEVRLVNLWTERDFEGGRAYLDVVADGVAGLSATGLEAPRVLVLGAPNAFAPILNLPPPRGGMPGASRNDGPPGELLANVDVVMEPLDFAGSLRDALRPELEASFATVTETEHWRLHRRSAFDDARAVSTSAGRRKGPAE